MISNFRSWRRISSILERNAGETLLTPRGRWIGYDGRDLASDMGKLRVMQMIAGVPRRRLDCRCGMSRLAQMVHEDDALARANRIIADAMRRIADQRACIDMLRRDGHGTAEAESLLALFETSLMLMIEYRDRISRELGRHN